MAQDLSKATDALEDPFLGRSVNTAGHVRRFLPFYVFGVVWAVTLALFPSIGPGKADSNDDIFASAPDSGTVARARATTARTDAPVPGPDAAAGATTDAPGAAAAAGGTARGVAPKAGATSG